MYLFRVAGVNDTGKSGEFNNRSSETQIYLALTRVMGSREARLRGGVVWGTPLEL